MDIRSGRASPSGSPLERSLASAAIAQTTNAIARPTSIHTHPGTLVELAKNMLKGSIVPDAVDGSCGRSPGRPAR